MSGGINDATFQTVEMQKEERNPEGASGPGKSLETKSAIPPSSESTSVLYPRPAADPFDARKYFATRPGAFDQAMDDLQAHVLTNMGETAHGFWLLTEIDHWNNERERVVVITDLTLLICKYDFIMLKCLQVQKVPLSYVDRVCMGSFTFPEKSLERRDGEGLRLFWDKQREPSFLSRWNPWTTNLPYTTFTEHPVKNSSQRFSNICQLSTFTAQLVTAVQNAQRRDPVPGRTGGVTVVNEPIFIDTYAGLTSFIGNRNKECSAVGEHYALLRKNPLHPKGFSNFREFCGQMEDKISTEEDPCVAATTTLEWRLRLDADHRFKPFCHQSVNGTFCEAAGGPLTQKHPVCLVLCECGKGMGRTMTTTNETVTRFCSKQRAARGGD